MRRARAILVAGAIAWFVVSPADAQLPSQAETARAAAGVRYLIVRYDDYAPRVAPGSSQKGIEIERQLFTLCPHAIE